MAARGRRVGYSWVWGQSKRGAHGQYWALAGSAHTLPHSRSLRGQPPHGLPARRPVGRNRTYPSPDDKVVPQSPTRRERKTDGTRMRQCDPCGHTWPESRRPVLRGVGRAGATGASRMSRPGGGARRRCGLGLVTQANGGGAGCRGSAKAAKGCVVIFSGRI